MPDAGRIKHTDRDAGSVQGGDELPFITAGGLANNLDGRVAPEKFEELAVARRGIGQVMDTSFQMELQVLLGKTANLQEWTDCCRFDNASPLSLKNSAGLCHRFVAPESTAHKSIDRNDVAMRSEGFRFFGEASAKEQVLKTL